MSNTLKFGNGTWATKKGSTLAYNDENDNYKPLPFTTTRASGATRVNKEGLIEVVENDRPRIDYTDNAKGALLLEPQRTNLITYSENFVTNWSTTRATITSNQIISPYGTQNADLLTITDTSENYVQTNVSLTVSGTKQTVSCFVKKGTNDFAHILLWDTSSSGCRQWFNLENGTIESSSTFGSGISVDSALIENYGNGWFRCIVVFNCSLTSVRTRISASNGDGQTNGTIGKTIYIWGFQVEGNSSYPTSYIPTQGASATRLADTASGAGNSEVFNDSEGVLFADMSTFVDDNLNRQISISNGTTANSIKLTFIDEDTLIFERRTSSGDTQDSIDFVSGNFTKIAFQYKSNNYKAFVNGFEISLTQSVNLPTSLNTLNFDNGAGSGDFYGNVKDVRVYNTALTDLELQQLTAI